MRLGRAKAARKTLKFYSINCNIKPPYKIILDGNFLAAIIKQNVPLLERLERLLQTDKFTIYTLRSALDELNLLPGEVFQQARQFGLDECQIIERKSIPKSNHGATDADSSGESTPKQDIMNLVRNGNEAGWFVATQDETLADKIRQFPNVPQMRLAKALLLLESPSSSSRRYAMREEKGKQSSGGGTMTSEERDLVQRLKEEKSSGRKRQRLGGEGFDDSSMRKKQKAKGPNPLSCKKKKSDSQLKSDSKKRNRRRKKNETYDGT